MIEETCICKNQDGTSKTCEEMYPEDVFRDFKGPRCMNCLRVLASKNEVSEPKGTYRKASCCCSQEVCS
jgi:hypothetical protein